MTCLLMNYVNRKSCKHSKLCPANKCIVRTSKEGAPSDYHEEDGDKEDLAGKGKAMLPRVKELGERGLMDVRRDI